MGKRRVRNLQALGFSKIAGYDSRKDRLLESSEKYGIDVFESFEDAVASFKPDTFIISTPPDKHMHYAFYALQIKVNCFIEASVVDEKKIYELHHLAIDSNLIMVPSCTMQYYPAPRKIKELVNQKIIGKLLFINYHTGQYLPDWHPWEDIGEYYVSNRVTGAAREIVPFELTWLNNIFGKLIPICCYKNKLSDIEADIDDLYLCIGTYENGLIASIAVDVISRPNVTREFRLLGSEGEIVWSAETNTVSYIRIDMQEWRIYDLDRGTIEKGYINPEEPYILEIKDFISAIKNNNPSLFPNRLIDDCQTLELLNNFEKISN